MSGRGFKCLGITAALLMGCSMNNGKPGTQVLRMHFPDVKLILDPHRMEDAFSMAVVTQLYRGLLRYDLNGDVVPDLAQSWTESPDHLRYRFVLKTAAFSDASPITAKHVQASFARIFSSGSSMSADLDYISGATTFKKSRRLSDLGVHLISDREIEFILTRPSVLFLKQLAVADTSILPILDFDANLDTSDHGVFSGPFHVKKASKGLLEIARWRSDPLDSKNPPHEVRFIMTARAPTELARSGDTDSLDRDPLTASERSEFEALGWKSHPTALMREEFVILNPRKVPPRTRKYLVAKFDSEAMLKALGITANFEPAFGMIPNGLLGKLSKEDLEVVKSAGSESGDRPDPGRVVLEYDDGSQVETKVAGYLSRLWSTNDFMVEAKAMPKQDRLKRMFGKLSQASLGGKQLDYPDGYSVLTYFKGGVESNYFHVEDEAIDRELTKLVSLTDTRAREAAYRSVQVAALKHHTVVPMYFGSDASGFWSSHVAKVPAHPAGYHTLALETVEMM